MADNGRNGLQVVLDQLDSLRAAAGRLTAEDPKVAIDASGEDVVADYLEKSIVLCTKQIGDIQEVIIRASKIRTRLQDEEIALATKRQTFFNALAQLDKSRASQVRGQVLEIEEQLLEKDAGEFSDLHVWEAARIVLQRTGREMTTREIVAAIEEGGKALGPKATSKVSAALRTGKAAEMFKPVKISGSRQRWALIKQGTERLPLEDDENEG